MNAIAECLTRCAGQFRYYEKNHIEKGQLDKANANAMYAELCEEALKTVTVDSFLKHLREQSSARADDWHHDQKWNVMEWGCAMAGEAGEACNVAKKIRRVEQGIQRRKEEGYGPVTLENLRAKLAEEIADTIIYLDLLAANQGIDIETAVTTKFNSVSEQFGFPQRL